MGTERIDSDSRWDVRDEKDQPAVSKCVATLVADPKVAVSKATVEAEVPKDFVSKTESVKG